MSKVEAEGRLRIVYTHTIGTAYIEWQSLKRLFEELEKASVSLGNMRQAIDEAVQERIREEDEGWTSRTETPTHT